MATWQSLRHHVATSYPVGVDELERRQNPEWDGLSVWVQTLRGRRLVVVFPVKDHDDERFLQISSPIETTRQPDLAMVLEWSGRNAGGALVRAEGDFFYKRLLPLEWLDLARTDAALRNVATVAASVESMLAEQGWI